MSKLMHFEHTLSWRFFTKKDEEYLTPLNHLMIYTCTICFPAMHGKDKGAPGILNILVLVILPIIFYLVHDCELSWWMCGML